MNSLSNVYVLFGSCKKSYAAMNILKRNRLHNISLGCKFWQYFQSNRLLFFDDTVFVANLNPIVLKIYPFKVHNFLKRSTVLDPIVHIPNSPKILKDYSLIRPKRFTIQVLIVPKHPWS